MLQVRLQQTGPIVLDATLQCRAGELLALVGPSGAGKSTILRAIAGLTRVENAQVSVDGECWHDSAEGIWLEACRRQVGMVFQSYALFPHLSVLDNVAEAVHHLPRVERRQLAAAALSRVRLGGLEDRRPHQLSGGQQQRVALARALVRQPKVLLLDEPFASVDHATRERLYEELAELRESLSIPVVLVTHSMLEAQLLADRMVVLRRGRTLQEGTPTEVLSRPDTEEVARLVGFGNLFETTVLRIDEAAGVTHVAWGASQIVLPRTRHARIGEMLRWGIATGDVVILKQSRGHDAHSNVVTAQLEKATFLGDSVHLKLRSEDGSAILRAVVTKHFFERSGIERGQVIRAEMAPDRLLSF